MTPQQIDKMLEELDVEIKKELGDNNVLVH